MEYFLNSVFCLNQELKNHKQSVPVVKLGHSIPRSFEHFHILNVSACWKTNKVSGIVARPGHLLDVKVMGKQGFLGRSARRRGSALSIALISLHASHCLAAGHRATGTNRVIPGEKSGVGETMLPRETLGSQMPTTEKAIFGPNP